MAQNDYEKLAELYQTTNEKPDKKYSILPTILMLAGDLTGKTVVDLGCGSGFFTRALALGAKKVTGYDNSVEQIGLARKNPVSNVEYVLADIMNDELSPNDVINAPFVLGYCSDVNELKNLFAKIYATITQKGLFIGVVDLPSGEDLKKYGATKILYDTEDGAKIEIILSNGTSPICTLWATFFSPQTIESLLKETGFCDIKWHKPIISTKGLKTMPSGYWTGYTENCELGYFTAEKH